MKRGVRDILTSGVTARQLNVVLGEVCDDVMLASRFLKKSPLGVAPLLNVAAAVLIPMHKGDATVDGFLMRARQTSDVDTMERALSLIAATMNELYTIRDYMYNYAATDMAGLVPIKMATSYNKPLAFWAPNGMNRARPIAALSSLMVRDRYSYVRTLGHKYYGPNVSQEDVREAVAASVPVVVLDLKLIDAVSNLIGDKVGVKGGKRRFKTKKGRTVVRHTSLTIKPVNLSNAQRFVAVRGDEVLGRKVYIPASDGRASLTEFNCETHHNIMHKGYPYYRKAVEEINRSIDMRRNYLPLRDDVDVMSSSYLAIHALLARIEVGLFNLLHGLTVNFKGVDASAPLRLGDWMVAYTRPNVVTCSGMNYETALKASIAFGSSIKLLPHAAAWAMTLAPVPYNEPRIVEYVARVDRLFTADVVSDWKNATLYARDSEEILLSVETKR